MVSQLLTVIYSGIQSHTSAVNRDRMRNCRITGSSICLQITFRHLQSKCDIISSFTVVHLRAHLRAPSLDVRATVLFPARK
jgi:hypothetical protein